MPVVREAALDRIPHDVEDPSLGVELPDPLGTPHKGGVHCVTGAGLAGVLDPGVAARLDEKRVIPTARGVGQRVVNEPGVVERRWVSEIIWLLVTGHEDLGMSSQRVVEGRRARPHGSYD